MSALRVGSVALKIVVDGGRGRECTISSESLSSCVDIHAFPLPFQTVDC